MATTPKCEKCDTATIQISGTWAYSINGDLNGDPKEEYITGYKCPICETVQGIYLDPFI